MIFSLEAMNEDGSRLRRILRAPLFLAATIFLSYVAVKAFWSAFDNDDFPEALLIKVELLPLIFPLHMVTGAAAVPLLPLTYALRKQRNWHRLFGRISAADILVSGMTAYPVALLAPVTNLSAAGFAAQATLWLILLGLGIFHIRKGNVAAHRMCMLLMAATTTGAIFFRIFLALWARFGDFRQFEYFYAVDAWIAWILPFGITAWMLRRRATG